MTDARPHDFHGEAIEHARTMVARYEQALAAEPFGPRTRRGSTAAQNLAHWRRRLAAITASQNPTDSPADSREGCRSRQVGAANAGDRR